MSSWTNIKIGAAVGALAITALLLPTFERR